MFNEFDPTVIASIAIVFFIGCYLIEYRFSLRQRHDTDSFILAAIEELTYGEGDTVTFCCENPDFDNFASDHIIICNGDWSNWTDVNYTANSRIDCLDKALKDRRQRIQQKAH